MPMRKFYHSLWRIALCAMLSGLTTCSDDDENLHGQTQWKEYKVAVILPYADRMQEHWLRLAQWACATLEEAQADKELGVRLSLEWYDESTVDISQCVEALSGREDVAALIGPFYSANADIAAKLLATKQLPILTSASASDLVRKYADTPKHKSNLWALCETDITQCEVMLSKALMYGAKRVSLIAQPSIYGQTFIDWFAFQACEMGLEVGSVVEYDSEGLENDMEKLLQDKADMALCVPSLPTDAVRMAQVYSACKDPDKPRLLFSDVAHSAKFLNADSDLTEGMEGITIAADPESGFKVAYEVRFGTEPTNGESQILDAFLLTGIAAYYKETKGTESLNDALREVVTGRGDDNLPLWTSTGMSLIMTFLDLGASPNIRGASGSLDFDAKVFTNVLYTTYVWWKIYEGKFITLDYNTGDGSKRTDASLAGWNWKNQQIQEVEDEGSFVYPEREGNYALVVAGSVSWANYRHQADALCIYQLLKDAGYDDDHIVLILADDIARNAKNPEQGVIRVRPDGDNVYAGAQIDYRLEDLEPDDIAEILCGRKSERLTQVINATDRDNVLVFWSGHGNQGSLSWGKYDGFYVRQMEQLMKQLNEGETRRYRKMLWLVEACHAGSIAEGGEGYPGVLYMTASSAYESSKADIYNPTLHVYMSNRFTATLEDELTNDITVSLRDLYYKLFRNTVGSHVTIYNQKNFDNLFRCTLEEFTVPVK